MPVPRIPFDWNDIPVLVALAHSSSMRSAGRKLGVTTSTISRRLAAAEKALQARLFVRGKDGYQPTDTGRLFLRDAEQIEGSIHALLSATDHDAQAVRGVVRVTSVDVMLSHWLIPRLPSLQAVHPELEITAIADNQVLSFSRGESDLALRVARPREDAALLMRRIGSVGMAVYGLDAFRRSARTRWNELPWLAFDGDLEQAAETAWRARHAPRAQVVFRSSSVACLLGACTAGLGVALLPCFVTVQSPLAMLSPGPVLQRELYLLSHRQAGRISRFRAVAEWIAESARRDAAALAGK